MLDSLKNTLLRSFNRRILRMNDIKNIVRFLSNPDSATKTSGKIPKELPIMPLRNTVAYPFTVLPLIVAVPRSIELIEEANNGDGLIGLVATNNPKT